MRIIAEYIAPVNQGPTCKGCEHSTPGWCKRYGSIIRNSEPVTRCEWRKTEIVVDGAKNIG